MQNCKGLSIMTSLRQKTSPGNEGNEALWKVFQLEYKLHTFTVNFKSHSIESLLIRYYGKILTFWFCCVEKLLRSLKYCNFLNGLFYKRS